MESPGERIAALRKAKKWSRPELGRQMQAAIQRPKPFSGEAVRRYEEGIDRPKGEARRALALALGTSEQYLEFGDAAQRHMAAESPAPKYGAEVDRLVTAFGWLMAEEKADLIRDLEAKATTNKAIARQLGPRFKLASDATMLAVLKRGGDFPPGAKKKKATPGRSKPKLEHPDDPDVE